jgi:hypothetical protein
LFIGKPSKCLAVDSGKKKKYVEGKRSIGIREMDIRNSEPVLDDDRSIFVAMTSFYYFFLNSDATGSSNH